MNWSASDKLIKQVKVELEQLSRLVEENNPLISATEKKEPSKFEISALAAFLHSFYTGIENIFGRIYVEVHGTKVTGEAWHKNLLQAMVEKNEVTSPQISQDLCDSLSEYLTFRHVFRQAYTFDIRWDKMKPLIFRSKAVFKQLSDELSARYNLLS